MQLADAKWILERIEYQLHRLNSRGFCNPLAMHDRLGNPDKPGKLSGGLSASLGAKSHLL